MEEEQELMRFVCKLCSKKYPCGKSLGGHMRSHVVAVSAESQDKTPSANTSKKLPSSSFTAAAAANAMSKDSFGIGPQSNYGLRDNPRKTLRAVDATFPLPQERVCKQCGKGFQSLKALCGHMACHSDRDKACLKDDHSWTSGNQNLVLDSHSDTEEAEDNRILRTRSSSKPKRYKKIVGKSPSFPLPNNNGSSSVSEIDGEEQEEVAMCLMLLSRDSGNKGGLNSVVESSDNNSVVLETKSSSVDVRTAKMAPAKTINGQETIPKKIGDGKKPSAAQMENSDSGYFLDECGKAESDLSVDGFHRSGSFPEYSRPLSRGEDYSGEFRHGLPRHRSYKGECEYDNGGMASNPVKIESRRSRHVSETPEPCNEYGDAHKRRKYECFNCKKTFKSYQALGGHRPCYKRSNEDYESRYDSGENSLDEDSGEFVARAGKFSESASNRKSGGKNTSSSQYGTDKKSKANKNKGYVCPFCNRVFKNGQALGGHKRSHFIGGHEIHHNHNSTLTKPDLLDLNLPAPEEEGNVGNAQFSHW